METVREPGEASTKSGDNDSHQVQPVPDSLNTGSSGDGIAAPSNHRAGVGKDGYATDETTENGLSLSNIRHEDYSEDKPKESSHTACGEPFSTLGARERHVESDPPRIEEQLRPLSLSRDVESPGIEHSSGTRAADCQQDEAGPSGSHSMRSFMPTGDDMDRPVAFPATTDSFKPTGIEPNASTQYRLRLSVISLVAGIIVVLSGPYVWLGDPSEIREVSQIMASGVTEAYTWGVILTGMDFGLSNGRYKLGEHWEMKDKIGSGHHGTVYKCRDKTTGFQFCAKKMNTPSNRSEVDTMLELRGIRGVVQIYGLLQHGNDVYILMQFLEGYTLQLQLVHEHKHIFCELLKISADMHSQGIVHNDMRSDNVMTDNVAKNGPDDVNVNVIDFGNAEREITQSGTAGNDISDSETVENNEFAYKCLYDVVDIWTMFPNIADEGTIPSVDEVIEIGDQDPKRCAANLLKHIQCAVRDESNIVGEHWELMIEPDAPPMQVLDNSRPEDERTSDERTSQEMYAGTNDEHCPPRANAETEGSDEQSCEQEESSSFVTSGTTMSSIQDNSDPGRRDEGGTSRK